MGISLTYFRQHDLLKIVRLIPLSYFLFPFSTFPSSVKFDAKSRCQSFHVLPQKQRCFPQASSFSRSRFPDLRVAIVELLDNVIDEVKNRATSVYLDNSTNPRDGNPALLIRDDEGGMDPESMRQCMSFGFSNKACTSIGHYGNGFKTSTMRIGPDVIVFSCSLKSWRCSKGHFSKKWTIEPAWVF